MMERSRPKQEREMAVVALATTRYVFERHAAKPQHWGDPLSVLAHGDHCYILVQCNLSAFPIQESSHETICSCSKL